MSVSLNPEQSALLLFFLKINFWIFRLKDSSMRGETETSYQNHIWYENIANTTNSEGATEKKAVADCLHLGNSPYLTRKK